MEHMKNLKEAERAAAEEENSDSEAHLTISRQDVYDQVKKGSILNDKQRSGRGRSSHSREFVNGRSGDGASNRDPHFKVRSAQRIRKTGGKDERGRIRKTGGKDERGRIRKTGGKDESRLRRSPRSPIKSDQSPSFKRRSVARGSLNGDTAIVSPGVRCRPVRDRK